VKEMTSPAENQCINADRPNGASLAWPTSGRALTTKSSGRLNLNVLDGGKAIADHHSSGSSETGREGPRRTEL